MIHFLVAFPSTTRPPEARLLSRDYKQTKVGRSPNPPRASPKID